jgi:hypothetical protein
MKNHGVLQAFAKEAPLWMRGVCFNFEASRKDRMGVAGESFHVESESSSLSIMVVIPKEVVLERVGEAMMDALMAVTATDGAHFMVNCFAAEFMESVSPETREIAAQCEFGFGKPEVIVMVSGWCIQSWVSDIHAKCLTNASEGVGRRCPYRVNKGPLPQDDWARVELLGSDEEDELDPLDDDHSASAVNGEDEDEGEAWLGVMEDWLDAQEAQSALCDAKRAKKPER